MIDKKGNMESNASSLSSSPSASSLLSSVLKELKRKTKKTPPVTTVMDQLEISSPITADHNGTGEFSTYSKESDSITSDKQNSDNNDFGVGNTFFTCGTKPQKPLLSPPLKPRRLKKKVNQTNNDSNGSNETLNGSHLPTEFQSLLESVFADGEITMSFSDGSKQCSPEKAAFKFIEKEGEKSSTKPRHLEKLDNSERKKSFGARTTLANTNSFDSVNDPCYDSISTYSALSDDGLHDDWLDNGAKRGSFDTISVSSMFCSNEKKTKKKKAKEKAKMLKKQAAAKKERVGALFDAATSNASDRIKKLRRGSIKIPIGKGKFQNIANK